MIVTRSVSDGSLNSDVLGQFKAQPRAILATGIILALLGLVPALPRRRSCWWAAAWVLAAS